MRCLPVVAGLVLAGALVAEPVHAGQDDSGRVTIRATRLAAPILIDGALDEAVYTSVPGISDFVQYEPLQGVPATQKTEVWLFFDRDTVYVAARCWESDPRRMVANEMRRDNGTNFQGSDNIGFLFDTFHDRQNATVIIINPAGGRNDGQVTNERQWNGDWNPVYRFQTGRFDGGWSVEIAVPFRSLRYPPGNAQTWGFNAVRNNYWKNELSAITRLPAGIGIFGVLRASLAATLTGLEVPKGSTAFEVKPSVISDLTSDRSAGIANDVGGDISVDAKYSITQGVTADLTYRTDFAQVEADEQQVNLTRFNLFFPEKREFFLENRGVFDFGNGTGAGAQATGDTPVLFYSRRIGFNQNRVVPIEGGGRVSGRIGRYSVGFLSIQTDAERVSQSRATNFTVARVKRDILRKSNVGVMVTGRSASPEGTGSNQAFGLDGTFAFFDNLVMTAYWATTRTSARSGDAASYQVKLDYAGDRYGVQLDRLTVGDNFNPEIGFVRRDDIRRNFGQFRFSPRSRAVQAVRKFSFIGTAQSIEDGRGLTVGQAWSGELAAELQNSDRYSLGYESVYDLVPRAFAVATGVFVPPGGYDARTTRLTLAFGQQRPLAGTAMIEHGTFYGGHKTGFSVSRGRVNLSGRMSLEPSLSINRVRLPGEAFTLRLIGSRVTYTMTPRMFVSALLQYNSDAHTMSNNVRLRWEYRPGSELFVVYNDQQDTAAGHMSRLMNRAVIVKFNRLVRFSAPG